MSTEQLSFPAVLSAEWLKMRTVRASWLAGLAALLLAAGGGALQAISYGHAGATKPAVAVGAVFATAMAATQIAVVILAVLVAGSEFSTGTIRVTLTAVPRRPLLMTAKAVTAAFAAAGLTVVALTVGYAASAPLLAHAGLALPLWNGHVVATLAANAAYAVILGLFAFAVALATRSTAVGLTTALGVVYVLPVLLSLAGGPLHVRLVDWALSSAAAEVTGSVTGHPSAAHLAGSLVAVVGWLAVPLLAAATALMRWDD